VLPLPNLESGDADVVASRCVIYLLRNSLRYAPKRDWPALAKDFKPVFTARGWRAGCFFGLDSRRDPGNGPGS